MRFPSVPSRALAAVVAVVSLGAAALPATAQEVSPKVVAGQPASSSGLEFVVAVGYRTNFVAYGMEDAHFCGGTLTSATKVVTAAHCLTKVDASMIVVGTIPDDGKLSSIEEAYTVKSITVHPLYDSETTENDVAVLTLSIPVDDAEPVDVALTTEGVYTEGTPVRVAGWGGVDYEGETYPDQIVTGDLTLVSDFDCGVDGAFETPAGQFFGWGALFLPETMVCAAGVDTFGDVVDACNGDSGGPLLGPGPVLIGVVSWGSQKCGFPAPGVYTRLGAVAEFLTEAGATESVEQPREVQPPVIERARALRGGQAQFRVTLEGAAWGDVTGQVRCTARSALARKAAISDSGTARVRFLRPGRTYQCTASVTVDGVVLRSVPVPVRARR